MRDVNRIEPLLALIKQVWLDNPDLRLGQLLMVCASTSEPDLWLVEDSEYTDNLQRMLVTEQ